DETEDLLELVRFVKDDLERRGVAIKAVCSGAILSTYQRTRAESVCSRLGLLSVAPLWEFPQLLVLADLQKMGIDARTLKVATIGLEPEKWLWKNVADARTIAHLKRCHEKWGVHPAGEGGEYETGVGDGPGFRYKVVVDDEDWEVVEVEGGVGYVRLKRFRLMDNEKWRNGLVDVKYADLERLGTGLLEPRFKEVYESCQTPTKLETTMHPDVNLDSIKYHLNISKAASHTSITNIVPTSSNISDFPAQLNALLKDQGLATRD